MRSFVLFVLFLGALGFAFANTRMVRSYTYDGPRTTVRRTVQVTPVTRTTRPNRPDQTMLVVVGDARETVKDAWQAALLKARDTIESEYDLHIALPDDEVTAQKLIAEDKELTVPLGDALPDVKKIELTLGITPDYVQKLAHRERDYRTEERMLVLGRGLAVLVAGFFAIAGYVRLDEWSKGYYSHLLKLVALAAVAGTIFGVTRIR